jgi:hypothetical protein
MFKSLASTGGFLLLHFASVSQPRPAIRPLLPYSKAALHLGASTRIGRIAAADPAAGRSSGDPVHNSKRTRCDQA